MSIFRIQIPILLLIISIGLGCKSTTSSTNNDGGADNNVSNPVVSASCEDGMAGEYPCQNIDLMAQLTPSELLGERLNDIWGWTDPATGKEYALVAMTDRVTFVDISSPTEPVVVGTLPESIPNSKAGISVENSAQHDEKDEGKSTWRDLKVYQNHAFVVSDGQPHGMQVFDLTRLRDVQDPPETFTEDLHYTDFGNAHNIAINEATGFAYVVGSNRVGGGLYILDINEPLNPIFAGSHADSTVGYSRPQGDGSSTPTGYVHDTQCVIYDGPDNDYNGREICFNSGETHLVIADVTDKSATTTIGKSDYPGREYAHQGWLTEDHQYFLLDDELDEGRTGSNTTTYLWDISDLQNPTLIGTYLSEKASIDHNQYVKGNHTYQANYTSGLRILDITAIASGSLQEVAFFDTHPEDDEIVFDGAWSNYPFFESGVVIVSDVSNGLFILSPNL